MARRDRFRRVVLRGGRLAFFAAVSAPFVVAMGIGFVWLWENGALLWFAGLSALALVLAWGVGWIARRREAVATPAAPDAEQRMRASGNPDWDASERAIFVAVRDGIDTRLGAGVEWEVLPEIALDVVRDVATRSGGKGELDFTLPEALRLIETATARFRDDLRRAVPFSDTVRVATLHWLWRNRDHARQAMTLGMAGWRLSRFVRNPPLAVLREIEGAIAGAQSKHLTAEGMTAVQGLLLEEVARAAVDLYSGHLRFSDAELLEGRRGEGARDAGRRVTPDAPVRIVIAGQVSAGKSSLVNALLDNEAVETDASPTTDRATAHGAEVDGVPVEIVDLPGLDGSAKVRDAVLASLAEADLVVWAVRATRPGREVDRATLAAWREEMAARPRHRVPPLVAVMTCADRLIEDWPRPELHLTRADATRVADVVEAVAAETGLPEPIPVSSVEPVWQIDMLAARLAALADEGIAVQRTRVRLAGEKKSARREMSRARAGVKAGAAALRGRFGRGSD